jgi:hypothetical protein
MSRVIGNAPVFGPGRFSLPGFRVPEWTADRPVPSPATGTPASARPSEQVRSCPGRAGRPNRGFSRSIIFWQRHLQVTTRDKTGSGYSRCTGRSPTSVAALHDSGRPSLPWRR